LRVEESWSTDGICIYIYIFFWKTLLVLGFLFPSFFKVFSPPPSKKTDKRKRRTQAGIIGEPLKRKLYYSLETLPHARAREKPLTQRKERERERKKERATLAEAVGREDPGESEKN
jgi:hypothetical protein